MAMGLVLANECLWAPASLAEVVPNGLNTTVDVQACSPSCSITGGSTRGSNLFHSFDEFSVPRNGIATFQHDGAIANIITRVTGGSTSRINGTIQALLDGSTDDVGTADFFFINPSGIVFGSNAQLDIGGSFIGSTAESLQFEDGTEFSVNDANPLLTISVPTGLQFGTDPGTIRITGTGHNVVLNPEFTVNSIDRPSGLEVVSGNTLGLIAGNLIVNAGNLTADSGRIELGAVSDDSRIELDQTSSGWVPNYSEVKAFGDIQFLNEASADVSGDNAGVLRLRGQNIIMDSGSSLLANTLTRGSGRISIQATESLQMNGMSSTLPSENSFPIPTSAYIEIEPGAVGTGRSTLVVNASLIQLTGGAQIGLSMAGAGTSGRVDINAETIIADSGSPTAPSGVFAAVLPVFSDPPATGLAGDLTIKTDSLQVLNGAQLRSSSFGLGNAGSFTITAQDIEVIGFNPGGTSTLQASVDVPPGGSGGPLKIDTARLFVADGGQIATATVSIAQPAGDLTIRASESIELQGGSAFGDRSGLFANAVSARNPLDGEVAEAFSEGGSISIETPTLIVSNGATINVGNNPSNPNTPISAPGNGPAGNLNITADRIQLLDQALLTADTVNGDRANITLNSDLIVLSDQSQITTNATGSATGGNLSIDTLTLTAFNNSDITANAVESQGGNIQIRAQGVFGIQPREVLTPFSDITASSQFGLDGTIVIESPDVEPEEGLVELPAQVVDISQLIAQACRQDEQLAYSQLSVTGRGGVPSHPAGFLNHRSIAASPRRPIESGDSDQSGTATITPDSPTISALIAPSTETTAPITEARGWAVSSNGQVILAAQAQLTSPHAYVPRQPKGTCTGL